VIVGGFDEKLVCGEDFEFFQRYQNCGNKTGKISSRILHIEGNPSPYCILSKAYYYGKTLPALVKKSPVTIVERYANLRLFSIRNAGITIKSIRFLIGFAAIKLLENFAYFVGIFTQLIYEFFEKTGIMKLKSNVLKNKIVLANISSLLLSGPEAVTSWGLSLELICTVQTISGFTCGAHIPLALLRE
jgi:hypothetical protein